MPAFLLYFFRSINKPWNAGRVSDTDHDMHTFAGENIEVKRFIKCIPQIRSLLVHTHTKSESWERGMFSRQTSESGSSELNFHVVSDPGELLYRAKNQPRSFNYRLSVASQCVATSLNGKWDEVCESRHRGQRARRAQCCNSFMCRLQTSPPGAPHANAKSPKSHNIHFDGVFKQHLYSTDLCNKKCLIRRKCD